MHLLLRTYVPLLVFVLTSFAGLGQSDPASNAAAPAEKPAYSLWLLGDTGDPAGENGKLPLLQTQIAQADTNSALVFLGNSFYPALLPKVSAPEREAAETQLKSQLDALKDFKGRLLLVPGDHGKKNREAADYRHQERFIATYLNQEKMVQPEGPCPGPVELHLSPDILLLLIDAKYMLPANIPPPEGSGCEVTKPSQVLAQIDDILRTYPEKQVVLAAHISPTMNGVEYRYLSRTFAQYLRLHPGLVFVQSNGAALSHYLDDSLHVVSAGTRAPKIKDPAKKPALFSDPSPGFARINFYSNGEAWLEFWTAAGPQRPAYRSLLMRKPTEAMLAADLKGKYFDFSDSVVQVSASQDYQVSKFKRWLLGQNYRQEWQQPVPIPVFDIGKIQGGLKVVQQGGGFQTRSLRLADAQGKEYVLRSVEKYPSNALPRPLRETIAADVLKDQISASHPYGPLVTPALSEAAGVYHTNPRYYYIPDDPRFGKYRTGFANTLGLFEERPDDDQSDAPHFGSSKKVSSTAKVIENIQEDNDDSVDQHAVVQARLFDFLIGDWDRHEDQWRWASFEKQGGKGKFYQPIPRDRDMIFFVNQGVVPNVGSRKWLMPKVQGFDHAWRDIAGFNFNARHFDRLFLTGLSEADWLAAASRLQQNISDDEIEKAVRQLPEAIFRLSGPDLIAKLKSHRQQLPEDARQYYRFLARQVDVVGSDKNELFEVIRQDDENTLVRVRKIDKTGQLEQLLYERQFKTSETREIRLYGLDGNDEFHVSGQVNKGLLVRLIGGEETDKITDESRVKGLARKTYVYDTKAGNELHLGSEARDLTTAKAGVNDYDPKAFKYDYLGPLAAFGYNRDDGLIVGGGVSVVKQGFKKEPFAASHRLLAQYDLLPRSFRFGYQGYFTRFVGKVDMQVNLDLRTPRYAENFFGLGNNTRFDSDRYKTPDAFDFYRYRSKRYYFNTLFGTRLGKHHSLLLGPAYQDIDINFVSDGFLAQNLGGEETNPQLYERKTYGGLDFRYAFDSRDNKTIPTAGNLLRLDAGLYQGLNSAAKNYQQLSADWAFYHTIRIPLKLTFANRVGGAKNFGDYEFFQAQVLDGNTNLRGYRRNRFSGGSSFYNNTDLRLRLFSFKTYLFPGSFGLSAFHDVGRVWQEGEDSRRWHTGYGGGLWISPVNLFIISAEYAVSKENRMPLLRAAFLF
ncbi:MAG: BamA/TamA family outer membrane protein [Adhaeribacter sp.]